MKNRTNFAVDFLAYKKSRKKYSIYNKWSLMIMILGIFLLPQIGYFSSITPEKIIELTNIERGAIGAKSLTANQLLTKAAYLKGQAILETQTFQHTIGNEKFSSWVRDAGYDYTFIGENLAIDFMTSEGIINAWLKSPSHKENLLNKDFKEIGVAVVEGKFQGQNSVIVVQIMGNPISPATNANNQTVLPDVAGQVAGATAINHYSTPITYLSQRPVKDFGVINLWLAKILEAFYVMRYLPVVVSVFSLFGLLYLVIMQYLNGPRVKEAK